ncbi:hypothetical protein SAMN05444166_3366 [Singulisphaera sp. GP187]|nr:hypothetical protein SAMN05444166_3366 [Singulisphaera sp. GP187]
MAEFDSGTGGRWVGPFRLRDYLERAIDPTHERPPEAAGVYIVSLYPWANEPTAEGCILYVGGNPKAPIQLRNRIGFWSRTCLGSGVKKPAATAAASRFGRGACRTKATVHGLARSSKTW